MRRVPVVIAAIVMAVGGLGIETAAAATLTVCATGCQFSSIQDALNSAKPGATIAIGAGTYNGELIIQKRVSLIGAGAAQTSIFDDQVSGCDNTEVTIAAGITVKINALTISGGGNNRSVNNAGALTLTKSAVVNGCTEQLEGGGNIYNSGALALDSTTIQGGLTLGSGGGIYNTASGTVTINQSMLLNNHDFDGPGGSIQNLGAMTLNNSSIGFGVAFEGAIFNGGTMTLNSTTLHGLNAFASSGFFNDGSLALNRSSITAGQASNGADGGGILNVGGAVVLNTSTVSNNVAEGDGGGIANLSGSVTLNNSLVIANQAGGRGGGIYNPAGSELQLHKSTVTGNTPDDINS